MSHVSVCQSTKVNNYPQLIESQMAFFSFCLLSLLFFSFSKFSALDIFHLHDKNGWKLKRNKGRKNYEWFSDGRGRRREAGPESSLTGPSVEFGGRGAGNLTAGGRPGGAGRGRVEAGLLRVELCGGWSHLWGPLCPQRSTSGLLELPSAFLEQHEPRETPCLCVGKQGRAPMGL